MSTRLFAPPAQPGVVERTRLLARIEQGLQRKLLLITAPPGFGKTTLLSSWRATQAGAGLPLAWVTLTEGDNEPYRFWTYVIAALDTIEPGVGTDALAVLRPPEQSETERAITELINALGSIPTRFVLVLDDYHLVHNAGIHEAVSFLIEHMPPQMHIIIASQEDPPLPLPRWRAHGQLAELHAADLRFTPEEAVAFLNHMGLDLSPADIADIEARTEGWIAGLQLAALLLQGGEDPATILAAFTGSHRFVGEYLAAEVLHKQPRPVQDFLLKTSILERLTPALCDAVTGDNNGREMLETVEQTNLFLVPLDEGRDWYRYLRLFGDFLRAQLQRTHPSEVSDLNCRAAGWFEDRDMIGEAIRHYVAADNISHASELIEANARPMFMRGELATVVSWLNMLPPNTIQARPQLGLVKAWTLVHSYRVEEAERALEEVKRHVTALNGDTTALLDAEGNDLSVEVLAISARLAAFRGQPDRVIEISRQALGVLTTGRSYPRSEIGLNLGFAYMDLEKLDAAADTLSEAIALAEAAGNVRGIMYAIRTLGLLYTMRGRLRQAAGLYRSTLENAARQGGDPSPSLGFVHASLSMVLLEWNDLDGALEHAHYAVDLGKQAGDGKILLLGYVPMVLAQQAKGEWTEALEGVDKLNRLSPGRYYAAVRAGVYLAQGDLEAASAWARQSGIDPLDDPRFSVEYECLTLARVLIAEGRIEPARRLLEGMLAQAEDTGRLGSALSVRIWLATALLAAGDTERAIQAILPALELAEAEGHTRSFIEVGPGMVTLLNLVTQAALDDGGSITSSVACAHRLLAAFATQSVAVSSPAPSNGHASLVEPLSDREIEILRLIEAGLSNDEISQRLVVTVGTVKTHLRNAYGKLDVHSRTQAIAKARTLQVI